MSRDRSDKIVAVDRRDTIITLSMTAKRRRLLAEWLQTARVNNTMDNGTYYGQGAADTREINHMLNDMARQLGY